jgi:two-component system NtrC family sensor kinase
LEAVGQKREHRNTQTPNYPNIRLSLTQEASSMSANDNPRRAPQSGDFPYFRSLWNLVVVALLAAAFLPLLVLGSAIYVHTTGALKASAIATLRLQVQDHRTVIDQFLAERAADLRLLAGNVGFAQLTEAGGLGRAYRSLQKELACFTDLGVIDADGNHRAYVGPYDLMARNYREQFWFRLSIEKGAFISDVYLGYRQVPHFIIAVKQQDADRAWLLRATVDADFFERFVAASAGDFKAEAYLVNREGVYQTRPRSAGAPMEKSPFPQIEPFEGIRIEERGERIFAMAWHRSVPWVSVVEMNRADIFADLDRARWICLMTFLLGALLIIPTVLLTTNKLVRMLESKRRDLRFLDQQLQHASKMASAGRLAQGALEDMTDSLANIHSASQWLRELWKQPGPEAPDPEEIRGTLDQIDAEVHRSEKAVQRGLELARPAAGPVCIDLDVHELIGELLDLMRREIHFKRIHVKRDPPGPAAKVCSDPDGLRQVLQNLIGNAVAAAPDGGEIEVGSRVEGGRLRLTVIDNGPGISEKDSEKIFEPLYTTKPDGLGLGLAISRTIVERLGGTLSARNAPGRGAAFTVELPLQFQRD